jgi:hypothetical protein
MKRALEESNDEPVVGRIQNPINFCNIQDEVSSAKDGRARFAGSWLRHDVRASLGSSELCPDNVWAEPTSLLSQESPMLNQKELGLIQIEQRLIQAVLFNTDILKTIISQYNDPCVQLKTVFDILSCCKNEILPNNGLIIICGDLGILDKLDRPKIFPILIDTLSFWHKPPDNEYDSPIGVAYKQIDNFFYPYYEDHEPLRGACAKAHDFGFAENMIRFANHDGKSAMTSGKSPDYRGRDDEFKNIFNGVPFLIIGGFPSTCYLNIKNALKINFKEYVKSCDYDLSFVSDDIDELDKFGKKILSKVNPTIKIEVIKNDAKQTPNANYSEDYFNKQNSKFILDYPRPVLKELYKITRRLCTDYDHRNKGINDNAIYKERHLLDIKTVYSQKEKMDSIDKLLFNIFASFDLTCSCFAFFRISEKEKIDCDNDDGSVVKVYSTPYNLYYIISKNYNFTSIINNPTKKRISKYKKRGWNYKEEQEPVKKEKVRKIIYFQRPKMTEKKYAANQNARNYLLEKEKLLLLNKESIKNEYENAVISVISKLLDPEERPWGFNYYDGTGIIPLLSKSQLLSQYNFEGENISKRDYIILYGIKKILKDLLSRGYIETAEY